MLHFRNERKNGVVFVYYGQKLLKIQQKGVFVIVFVVVFVVDPVSLNISEIYV